MTALLSIILHLRGCGPVKQQQRSLLARQDENLMKRSNVGTQLTRIGQTQRNKCDFADAMQSDGTVILILDEMQSNIKRE
mmetsp:Transcript_14908/g.21273  ORF Transcript_14908/g.21273 Transcript_14908/m.21273 type:complete len:80 (-) Transcript_14908:172-411(-)